MAEDWTFFQNTITEFGTTEIFHRIWICVRSFLVFRWKVWRNISQQRNFECSAYIYFMNELLLSVIMFMIMIMITTIRARTITKRPNFYAFLLTKAEGNTQFWRRTHVISAKYCDACSTYNEAKWNKNKNEKRKYIILSKTSCEQVERTWVCVDCDNGNHWQQNYQEQMHDGNLNGCETRDSVTCIGNA